MLLTVAAVLECRRPAFYQCAVTFAAVRAAGLEEADHLVRAACSVAFAWTTAMFGAESSGARDGDAVWHGALRFLLSTFTKSKILKEIHRNISVN